MLSTPGVATDGTPLTYRFPYPCTFTPIPYDTNSSLPRLLLHTIPAARSIRSLNLVIPRPISQSDMLPLNNMPHTEFTLALPTPAGTPSSSGGDTSVDFAPAPATVGIRPDGLLIYVAAASYEPGTSPLSSWVPIIDYDSPEHEDGLNKMATEAPQRSSGGRLDLFERWTSPFRGPVTTTDPFI
jgi:snurportin-1